MDFGLLADVSAQPSRDHQFHPAETFNRSNLIPSAPTSQDLRLHPAETFDKTHRFKPMSEIFKLIKSSKLFSLLWFLCWMDLAKSSDVSNGLN